MVRRYKTALPASSQFALTVPKSGVQLVDIARREQVPASFIRTRAQLAFLSPKIQAAILDGSQPPGKIGGDSTAALIRQARNDEDVKAIAIREAQSA